MKKINLVFPNQLFYTEHNLKKDYEVWLVEDYLFFRQFNFHKKKIAFHEASMKAYTDFLLNQNFEVKYIKSENLKERHSLRGILQKEKVTEINYTDVVDDWLERDINSYAKELNINLNKFTSPNFLTSENDIKLFFKNKKPFMKTFYEWQRKRLDILMEKGKPVGGKWSFDTENRKKLPKDYVEPKVQNLEYVGTREFALKMLDDFVENRLQNFGKYEDAISSKFKTINHSVLSMYINVGILSPKEVVDKAVQVYYKNNMELASVEGFVRQIIGWREFMRAMYILYGREMRTRNFWRHTKRIDKSFYDATTGIDPLDTSIRNVLDTGYNHHIERLMVIGNYMLLSEIHPDDVYKWFMEMYIDSYDWVMVPNVYGMSQYADGGIFATKPYISASNYIIKMSDYKKGEWSEMWDKKFWDFVMKNKEVFKKNYRMSMLITARENREKLKD